MEDLINILKVLLFGIIEGITEWLPVSSTGHMIILEEWLNIEETFGKEFWSLFLVVIQLGAIMAVLFTFIKKIWPFGKSKTKEEKRKIWMLLVNIIIACLPAAVAGLFLDDLLDQYLMNFITVSITLIVYGVLFIVLEMYFKKKNQEFKTSDIYAMSIKTAFIIGCAQILALIPGTSRSGITILAAMLIGCDRKVAAEFSFLVAIPIMFGASGLKTVKFMMSGSELTTDQFVYLLFGCIVAFLVSILTIKYFLKFINRNTFISFGYYRIALGVLLITYFLVTTLVKNANYDVLNYLMSISDNNFENISSLVGNLSHFLFLSR